VPLTSKVEHLYPSEARLNVKGKPNKAMADQITTVSKLRMINRIARVSAKDLLKIEQALKIQLGIIEPI
jgi:mRNA interferase MazF